MRVWVCHRRPSVGGPPKAALRGGEQDHGRGGQGAAPEVGLGGGEHGRARRHAHQAQHLHTKAAGLQGGGAGEVENIRQMLVRARERLILADAPVLRPKHTWIPLVEQVVVALVLIVVVVATTNTKATTNIPGFPWLSRCLLH